MKSIDVQHYALSFLRTRNTYAGLFMHSGLRTCDARFTDSINLDEVAQRYGTGTSDRVKRSVSLVGCLILSAMSNKLGFDVHRMLAARFGRLPH